MVLVQLTGHNSSEQLIISINGGDKSYCPTDEGSSNGFIKFAKKPGPSRWTAHVSQHIGMPSSSTAFACRCHFIICHQESLQLEAPRRLIQR
jgi:hypothetical protein